MSAEGFIFDGALWVAVLIAMLAGLISFVSPCVLPLVPGYFGYLGSSLSTSSTQGHPATARGRLLGGVALFVAGFTLVFMTVTVLGGVAGLFFLEYANILTRVLGVVVIIMGLAFIGAFPRAQRTLRPRFRGNVGLFSAPLLGIALGIGWTPCIGPILGAILTVSASSAQMSGGIWLLSIYSAGLGVPFLLAALFTDVIAVRLKEVGHAGRLLYKGAGGVMVIMGLAMMTGQLSRFAYWLLDTFPVLGRIG